MTRIVVAAVVLTAAASGAPLLVRAADPQKPASSPAAAAPSFAGSMAWLEEQEKSYGRVFVEKVGAGAKNPLEIVHRLNPAGREKCRMTVQVRVTKLDEKYAPLVPARTDVHTIRFSLKDVIPDKVTVRQDQDPKYRVFAPKTGKPVECAVIRTRPKAMSVSRGEDENVATQDSVDICFAEKGIAGKAVKAVKEMAEGCGAGKP